MRRPSFTASAALCALFFLFIAGQMGGRLAAQDAAGAAAASAGSGVSSGTTSVATNGPVSAAAAALPPGFGETKAKPENPWRRFEIVSVGAFPISLFYMGFGFDLGGYIGSGFDSRYAPWPFQSSASVLPTDSQRVVRIASAVGLSLVIGGIDAIIHAAKIKAEARQEAAKSVELDSAGAGD